MSENRVMLSGGGTGGHIFPAIAIAHALQDADPDTIIQFVGASDRMEMQKVPEAGFEIRPLWISGIQRKLSAKNLTFPFKLLSSLWRSYRYIKAFRPDVVIGTGGFASGPLLWVASRMNIPTLIQEQNSFPGITNKLLAPKVNKICVAYPEMKRFFPQEKIVFTGNPTRKNLLGIASKREEAMRFFKLDPNKKVILFIGGSLGARAINLFLKEHLGWFIDNDVQLLWQCGKLYYADCLAAVEEIGAKDIQIHQFIKQMDLAYAAADMVVSRAGAIAISELAVTAKPAILIPSPNVAEDHQTKNAQAMVEKNAACLVREKEMKDNLLPLLETLLNDSDKREALSSQIQQLAGRSSAEKIAEEVKKLM